MHMDPMLPGDPASTVATGMAAVPATAATRARWRMAALIFLVSVITFIDRVNITIAARMIIPEYGLSEVQMGTIFSAFVLGYTIGFLPGGSLADRFGSRQTLGIAMIVWSVLTAATAWAGNIFLASLLGVVPSFVAIRLLFGIAEGPTLPTLNRLIGHWFPTGEKGLATSMMTVGIGFGAVTGPPLVSWIMNGFGWRAVFVVMGGMGLLVGWVWYAWARDSPDVHRGVNEAELALIRKSAASVPGVTATPDGASWGVFARNPNLWMIVVSYALLAYVGYTFTHWLYLYLVNQLKIEATRAAWCVTLPFVATMVLSPLGARMSDVATERWGRRPGRIGTACLSLLLSTGTLYTGASSLDPVWALAFLSVAHGLMFIVVSVMLTTVAEMMPSHVGAATGLLMTGGHVGAIIAPTLSPMLAAAFGWQAVFQIMALFTLLSGVVLACVNPATRN